MHIHKGIQVEVPWMPIPGRVYCTAVYTTASSDFSDLRKGGPEFRYGWRPDTQQVFEGYRPPFNE
jgi:hypothetical protein